MFVAVLEIVLYKADMKIEVLRDIMSAYHTG